MKLRLLTLLGLCAVLLAGLLAPAPPIDAETRRLATDGLYADVQVRNNSVRVRAHGGHERLWHIKLGNEKPLRFRTRATGNWSYPLFSGRATRGKRLYVHVTELIPLWAWDPTDDTLWKRLP